MRFVSRFGRYGVQIVPQIVETYATGATHTIQEGVYAQFSPQGLLPHERELAMARWSWPGFYQEQDEVTQVPPDHRIGVFDSQAAQITNGWSDELREQVEQKLIVQSEEFNDLFAVPASRVPPPWPRYDEYKGAPAALVRKLEDEGHELADVLEYERAMQNREPIVAALEAALAEEPVEEEILG